MQPIPIGKLNLGGIGDSDYMGREGTVAEMVGLDVHTEPGAIKALNKLTAMVHENLPDEFCKVSVNCSNGRIYWFSSESGKIWEDNSGTFTLKYTIDPMHGEAKILGALEYEGFIYWTTQNLLHRIRVSKASGTWEAANSLEIDYADLSLDQELERKTPVALKFDGVDDRLTIASFALDHTDITFSCWFYAEQDTSDTSIYQIWGANDTANCIQVELGGDTTAAPNRNRVCIRSGSTIVAQTDSNAFVAGTWNQLIYTRATNTHHIYVNGIERALITDATTAFANTTTARYIATKNSSNANPFKGFISDIRILNAALTAQQALDTYNKVDHITTGSLVYYPLNNSIRDFIGSNHGVISGNPGWFYITDYEIPFRTELASSLLEIDTDRKFFQANAETLINLKLKIVNKGSGSVTVTVHDSEHSVVGTTTVTNGNLINGDNYITLDIDTLTLNGIYHLHVFSSTTGTYILSNNYNDISDSFYYLLSDGDIEFHPMKIQNNTLFIGDRNYIHQVDTDRETGEHIFSNRALDMPYPLRAKCLGNFDTDLIIGTVVDARIAKTKIIRWDTWSVSWKTSDEIPEEGINAFIDADNFVIVAAGKVGNRYFYNGKDLELMGNTKGDFESGGEVIVNPNAAANFKGIALFGLSNFSGNPAMQGVYSYGSRNADYPTILNLAYPISQRDEDGNFVTSNLEIGVVMVVGNDIYVSWRDSNGEAPVVGIDKIDYTAKLDGAYFSTLVMDLSSVFLNNYQQYLVKYISIPENTDIEMEYKINFGSWTELPSRKDAIKLQKIAMLTLQAAPLQWKVKLSCNANVSPKFRDATILAN